MSTQDGHSNGKRAPANSNGKRGPENGDGKGRERAKRQAAVLEQSNGVPDKVHTCTHTNAHAHTHACTHGRTNATRTRAHARTRARTHARTHACMHVVLNAHACTRLHSRTDGRYTHTHACTHARNACTRAPSADQTRSHRPAERSQVSACVHAWVHACGVSMCQSISAYPGLEYSSSLRKRN